MTTELDFALAQLRHAYHHLAVGRVTDQRQFADGLISPVIARLEKLQRKLEDQDAARVVARLEVAPEMKVDALPAPPTQPPAPGSYDD